MLALMVAAVVVAAQPDLHARSLEILGKWVDAQNHADVAAYTALYDTPRFHGVKRAPRGTTEYDWKAWIADRTKMMGAHPTVATDDATVELWSDRASKLVRNAIRVRFVQRWKSARYADHGIKVLDLAYDAKASTLVIRREELLNSLPGWNADDPVAAPPVMPKTAREAEAALVTLGLTAADTRHKLASITDPVAKKVLAGAVLEQDFECKRTEIDEGCGGMEEEWAPLAPSLAWPDPCVARIAAAWAVAQLDPSELKLLTKRLLPVFGFTEAERELPFKILAASRRADDATRLAVLEAAVKGGRSVLAASAVEGLGAKANSVAATKLRLAGAIARLDLVRDRATVLTVLEDDQVAVFDRRELLDRASKYGGADFDAVLRHVSESPDCALAMRAASLLSERGDTSRLPRRVAGGDPGRFLCLVLHDADASRAEASLRTLVGPRGLKIDTRIDYTEILPSKSISKTFTPKDLSVDDIPDGLGGSLLCGPDDTCKVPWSNGDVEVRFAGGFLVEIAGTTLYGCTC